MVVYLLTKRGIVQVVHGGGTCTHDAMEYNSSVCTNKQSEQCCNTGYTRPINIVLS